MTATPWKPGDILYLKTWDTSTEDDYRKNDIKRDVTDHPAVLLYRHSPSSPRVVVAVMTSLGGQQLARHRYAQSTPERRKAHVPIEPASPNPDSPLYLKMAPKPCLKRTYINTGQIITLPASLLKRFGDRGGHEYSLSKKSTRELLYHLRNNLRIVAAQSVARVQEKTGSSKPRHARSARKKSRKTLRNLEFDEADIGEGPALSPRDTRAAHIHQTPVLPSNKIVISKTEAPLQVRPQKVAAHTSFESVQQFSAYQRLNEPSLSHDTNASDDVDLERGMVSERTPLIPSASTRSQNDRSSSCSVLVLLLVLGMGSVVTYLMARHVQSSAVESLSRPGLVETLAGTLSSTF